MEGWRAKEFSCEEGARAQARAGHVRHGQCSVSPAYQDGAQRITAKTKIGPGFFEPLPATNGPDVVRQSAIFCDFVR